MRELAKKHSWVTRIIHVVLAAVVLALSGPFGTYTEFDLFERLLFWMSSLAAAGIFIHSIVYLALAVASESVRMAVMAVLVGTALASVPAAAAIMEIFSYISGSQIGSENYPRIWSNVVLIGILVALIQFWPQVVNAGKAETEDAVEPARVSAPSIPELEPAKKLNVPLLARLPNCVEPGKIVSFSMQDHYVELMTIKGPHLLLMRFSDAISLLGDLQGIRIHRSHWVATQHLEGIEKQGRRMMAILSDGRRLPVSATYVAHVHAHLNEKSAA